MRQAIVHIVVAVLALGLAAEQALAARAVYWVDAGTIYRADADGGNAAPVVASFVDQLAIDPVEGRIYFTGDLPLGGPGPSGRIWRSNLDGSQQETLMESFTAPAGIALEPTGMLTVIPYMFWTDGATIQRANHEGSDVQDIVDGLQSAFGVAFDPTGRKVYWTQNTIDQAVPAVQRSNMDGSDIENLVKVLGPTTGIAVDAAAGKMYWGYVNPLIDSLFPGSIQRANLDGTDIQTVVSGLAQPLGVALDPVDGWVYWTDAGLGEGQGSVMRARLDGSDVQPVAKGLAAPGGVAVDVVPEPGMALWAGVGVVLIMRRRRVGSRKAK